MPDLSIIVPVYNTPTEALERCFASVKGLSVSYEVLVVDDGSKEPAATFCREYANNNPGFSCFPKENGGVSSARNYGLSQATGKYITFLDADDILLPDVFTPELMASDTDLVIFDTQLVENGRSAQWYAFDRESGPLCQEELLAQLIASKSLNGPYAKLMKRELIACHNICFNTAFVTGEDWDFVCSYCLVAKTAAYRKEASYVYYRDGGNSKSRIGKFPDTVLQNLVDMFRRKEGIAQDYVNHSAVFASHLSTAAVFLIEDLFNSAADLHLLKKLTPQRKALIIENTKLAKGRLQANASKKTKLKAWILENMFFLLYPVSHLRELYLSMR